MKIRAYITKSEEVSRFIERAIVEEAVTTHKQSEEKHERSVTRRKLYEDTSVPAIYHNKDYWLVCYVIHCEEDLYSLTIA